MATFSDLINELEEEDEIATVSQIERIRCTPISSIGLRQMNGIDVDREEIVSAMDSASATKKELEKLFDRFMRTYVGGVFNAEGQYWEFGLCSDEEDVAKMSADVGDYASVAERWCAKRGVSRASTEPSPTRKVALFFDMIVDMGLDDVDELKHEDYSCRVIVKAIEKLNLLRTVPVSAWTVGRPSGLKHDEDWGVFKKLIGIP